jgi:hypothetical protein
MNAPIVLSSTIALALADIWRFHKSETFADYVARTYGKHLTHLPSFECVYIAEIENGNLDKGEIGGIVRKWWMVDDRGTTEIRRPELPRTDEPVFFDRRPVLKFYTDGERIVTGERLGPNLICRQTGKLVSTNTSVSITDVRLVWATNADNGHIISYQTQNTRT